MKADKVIKNAKIFTADRDNPQAMDLFTAEHEGFSYNEPAEVYFGGMKMN